MSLSVTSIPVTDDSQRLAGTASRILHVRGHLRGKFSTFPISRLAFTSSIRRYIQGEDLLAMQRATVAVRRPDEPSTNFMRSVRFYHLEM